MSWDFLGVQLSKMQTISPLPFQSHSFSCLSTFSSSAICFITLTFNYKLDDIDKKREWQKTTSLIGRLW
jgi:hypothetical protein